MGSGGIDISGLGEGFKSALGMSSPKGPPGIYKGLKKEYGNLQGQVMDSEYLNNLLGMSSEMANKDWMGYGKTQGMFQADRSTQAIMDALAGRGGGSIGDALSMGAQARVGAGMQGLQTGIGMKNTAMNQLQGLEMGRLSLLASLYGTLGSAGSAAMGAKAQTKSAELQAWGTVVNNAMDKLFPDAGLSTNS